MEKNQINLNVKRGRWHRFNLNVGIIKQVKKLAGINSVPSSGNYAFFEDNKITYIGQSVSIFKRLETHFKYFPIFASYESSYAVAIKLEKLERMGRLDRIEIERKLIVRLMPRGNAIIEDRLPKSPSYVIKPIEIGKFDSITSLKKTSLSPRTIKVLCGLETIGDLKISINKHGLERLLLNRGFGGKAMREVREFLGV